MSKPKPLLAPKTHAPGVTLVTSSMNRNGNLLRALPSWLAHPQVKQVVIVDWSSSTPVARDLARAGISDSRITIARAYGEPRWILSYAFNIGFRLAAFDQILKCDADIVLDADYFEQNPLEQGRFIAGNWRTAEKGQQFVNGFFHVHTADLLAVNGFNEYITTYGWDDDDLYDRLVLNGTARQDVAPGTVSHLDHEDVARHDNRSAEDQTAWTDLDALTMFKIRTNRFIATIMPRWTPDRTMRPYRQNLHGDGTLTLRRNGPSLHEVPDHITATAKRMAAYELVSWRAGIRTYQLDDDRFTALLNTHRLEDITHLRVELALSGASLTALCMPRILLVDLSHGAVEAGPEALAEAGARLARMAYRSGRLLVLRSPYDTRPGVMMATTGAMADAPYLPDFAPTGPLRDVSAEDVRRDGLSPALRLELDAKHLGLLPVMQDTAPAAATEWVAQTLPPLGDTPLAIPMIRPGVRARLYLDAQHGLGNRLRAMGSGAALARATGRELVVVWQPDHHCQGHLSDLFDYDGAVETESFIDRARDEGCTVLNYMEIEDGADKDARLVLESGRDAYIRSAYVLNHPTCGWKADNLLLRELRPVAAVLDLLHSAGAPADIGLHIRMEGAPGTDHNSYDSPENWTAEGHAAIHKWRTKSHYRHFMTRLDALLADKPEARVFLAADQPQTYAAFAQTYGDRIARIERDVYDRSAAQLRYALADILGLAQVNHLLGSHWSSFTEAALRMSTNMRKHEVAGRDF